jgi:hypothetical protein
MINKKNLEEAIEFISDLKLSDQDYNNILEKFKPNLQNSNFNEIFKRLSTINEISKERDLKTIMKKMIDTLNSEDLTLLLKDIMKNEEYITFIQDLFLEKLI